MGFSVVVIMVVGGGVGGVVGDGVEVVFMTLVGEGPVAEFGLVGGCVDLQYHVSSSGKRKGGKGNGKKVDRCNWWGERRRRRRSVR